MHYLAASMENLNYDQRDTVCKACTVEPHIQNFKSCALPLTRRKSCTSYETLKIMRIMKLSAHQKKILNYPLILIVIEDNSYFSNY